MILFIGPFFVLERRLSDVHELKLAEPRVLSAEQSGHVVPFGVALNSNFLLRSLLEASSKRNYKSPTAR